MHNPLANTPEKFAFVSPGNTWSVHWGDGRLLHYASQSGELDEVPEEYVPSAEEWNAFWLLADELCAWHWRNDAYWYDHPESVPWFLKVSFRGLKIQCKGTAPAGFDRLYNAICGLVRRPSYTPDIFSFGSQGWTAITVKWKEDRLLYSNFRFPEVLEKYVPSAEEWNVFWMVADEVGAWHWRQENYGKQLICGTPWSLRISFRGREIMCEGNGFSGAYAPPSFSRLYEAMCSLVRRQTSREEDRRTPEEKEAIAKARAIEVAELVEYLRAAETAHAAERRDGRACPTCGFSYAWNGMECRHCGYRTHQARQD